MKSLLAAFLLVFGFVLIGLGHHFFSTGHAGRAIACWVIAPVLLWLGAVVVAVIRYPRGEG